MNTGIKGVFPFAIYRSWSGADTSMGDFFEVKHEKEV